MAEIALIAAVNDEAILSACLGRSPDVASGRLALTAIRGARSMAEACNNGLERTGGRLAILAHQDVYLPAGWLDQALVRLAALERACPDWLVAGPYGVMADGTHAGLVWDAGLGRELGTRGFGHAPVVSLDELLLVIRRGAGLRFDPALPHFHLYGTDLVQTALAMGRGAYAAEMPLVHNSQRVDTLAGGYTQAYRYARKKWRAALPIPTTVCALSASPLPLWRAKWRLRKVPARRGVLAHDARELAIEAGYEAG